MHDLGKASNNLKHIYKNISKRITAHTSEILSVLLHGKCFSTENTLCVCVCVCVCERERERDSRTDRQTDRHRERERERERESRTDRERERERATLRFHSIK